MRDETALACKSQPFVGVAVSAVNETVSVPVLTATASAAVPRAHVYVPALLTTANETLPQRS